MSTSLHLIMFDATVIVIAVQMLSLIRIAFCNALLKNIWFYLQDFSKFLDEDFEVKEWVNAAFRLENDGTKDVST